MLTKLIIWVALKREKQFLRILSRLEFGVSVFCKKLAVEAQKEGNHALSCLLAKHSQQEERHGRMLASLADKTDRPRVKDNGAFLAIARKDEEFFVKPSAVNSTPLILQWGDVTAVFENFDGLSERYLSFQAFFAHKHAFDYGWADRLCFMQVLEGEARKFYQALSQSKCSEPLRAIAAQMIEEEKEHEDYLGELIHQYPKANINKWRWRLLLAKMWLIVDVANLWIMSGGR